MNTQANDPLNSAECVNDAAYVLGSLTPFERQAFERHLAVCPRCPAAVQRLAGLPGLLSMVGEASLTEDPTPLPENLLPRLLAGVGAERRRHRVMLAGSLALAAVSSAILVIVLVVGRTGPVGTHTAAPISAGNSTHPSASATPSAVSIMMTQVTPGPMNVTLNLVDKQWGTSITVVCDYGNQQAVPYLSYQLVAIDQSGNLTPAGSWAATSSGHSTVTTATSLPRSEIAQFQVRLPDGTVILRSSA